MRGRRSASEALASCRLNENNIDVRKKNYLASIEYKEFEEEKIIQDNFRMLCNSMQCFSNLYLLKKCQFRKKFNIETRKTIFINCTYSNSIKKIYLEYSIADWLPNTIIVVVLCNVVTKYCYVQKKKFISLSGKLLKHTLSQQHYDRKITNKPSNSCRQIADKTPTLRIISIHYRHRDGCGNQFGYLPNTIRNDCFLLRHC